MDHEGIGTVFVVEVIEGGAKRHCEGHKCSMKREDEDGCCQEAGVNAIT